eukprot:EG_transcript_35213
MPTAIKTEVLYQTSNDERYPSANMIDGDERTFWITTGMFPQEFMLGFKGSPATITKVRIWAYHIKKLTIEKCVTSQPTKFEKIVEVEVAEKNGAMQIESFAVNSTSGPDIRYLKFHIGSGWEDFASIHSIIVEGEPQRNEP